MTKEFMYYPESFGERPIKVEHMDLEFDVYDDYTNVTSDLTLTSKTDLTKIELNADNLEIHDVSANFDLSYNYRKKDKILEINFTKIVPKGTSIVIHTNTTCKPTHNILEGLYYDETPEGCPPQQITQCQQWGFQRMVPSVDDMDAKCTYKTKITADARYTHMITNGDIVQEKTDVGKSRSEIVYENKITPMSTYLFYLGVGTYESFNRQFEYPNGKSFEIELLVLPGAEKDAASKALDMLSYGVMWIHLFTGAGTGTDLEKRHEIFDIFLKKEELLLAGKDASDLQDEIKSLSKGLVMGYEYTGTVYREIAMQNSNFGGMENVGNTTIVANRIMPSKNMADGIFAYMMEVKTHEFYHNLNGSEVTGWSPFEFWLNEAITCQVEHQFVDFIAGKEYSRLSNLSRVMFPGGTFDEDSGSMSMPVRPEGFNNPDELVSGVTYSKSPEMMKMIELIVGKEKYYSALAKYHEKFSHSNATGDDWVNSMSEFLDYDITKMADSWLKQTGFPTVKADSEFNSENNSCKVTFSQSGFKDNLNWEFPISFAGFDESGKKLFDTMVVLKEESAEFLIGDVLSKPAFYSFNRNLSFYGKVEYEVSNEQLHLQARYDDDAIARYMAYYKLADEEKTKLVKDINSDIDPKFIELYFELLSNEDLANKVGSSMIMSPESVDDPKLKHYYEELFQAKKKIRLEIARKYETELVDIYNSRNDKVFEGPYVEKSFKEIKNRQVKNTCISILSELDTPKTIFMIKKQFDNGTNSSDINTALMLYLKSSATDKYEVLDECEKEWSKDLVKWEQFLSIVAMSDSDNTLELVKKVKNSDNFRIDQSNDQRALVMRFTFNQRLALLTSKGREFVKESIMELAEINEYNTCHILSGFSHLESMQEKYQADLTKILVDTLKVLDVEKTPSVYNNIRRLLKGAPGAVSVYETQYGELDKKVYK